MSSRDPLDRQSDRLDVLARWEAPQVISASFEPGDLNPRRAYTGAPRPGAHEVRYVRADLHRGAVEALREIRSWCVSSRNAIEPRNVLGQIARIVDATLPDDGGR
jgi:hypothetical protein